MTLSYPEGPLGFWLGLGIFAFGLAFVYHLLMADYENLIKPTPEKGGIKRGLFFVLQLGLFLVLMHTYVYKPFVIPSPSMVPTLLVGDYILVSKFKYGYSRYSYPYNIEIHKKRIAAQPPQQGDVVVFRPPHNTGEDWVKRVIGLPGDRIKVAEGIIYVNDKALPLHNTEKKFIWRDQYGEEFHSDIHIETLPNGRTHPILKTKPFGEAPLDNMIEVIVPMGHYFLVGDNRDFSGDSRDARFLGVVPSANIIGEADLRFFSTDLPTTHGSWWQFWRWPFSTRYERILNIIT